VAQVSSALVQFGIFSLELRTGALQKSGSSVRLAPQPSRVLIFLAGRAGQIVTREEIREHIWGQETFVDFDKGLNFCIKQIRTALQDDADRPTYIETLPRRGYRFIAPVEIVTRNDESADESRKKDENQATDVGAPTDHSRARDRNRRAWVLLAAIISLFCVGYGSFYRSRTLNFPNRGWVLIAAFENRTGEAILDGTVEAALQRELSESRFVSVLPQERIQDALWLMRKDKHSVLESDIAREVALRDGKTALVLTGRVEKLGNTYLLSTSLMEPTTGIVKRSLSEEAADQDAILPAVHRLARHVRDTVGETELPVVNGNEELEKVTTPSLRALQFYSKGIALINQNEWVAGQEMFSRAVQEDPEFASAHVYLAHCYNNAGNSKEAAAHFEKAFELADQTTDRERYFILGSYFGFKNDLARSIEAYQVLVQLYPDDFWGVNNLASGLMDAGREDDALPYIVRRAELRPNDLDVKWAGPGKSAVLPGARASSGQQERGAQASRPVDPIAVPGRRPIFARWRHRPFASGIGQGCHAARECSG
jgi:DNA-binding winged helix-turn-helix (wHTH) protein/tetratricopeptide (TPR) repeat protein